MVWASVAAAGVGAPERVVLQFAAQRILRTDQIDVASQAKRGQRPQHGDQTGRRVPVLQLGDGGYAGSPSNPGRDPGFRGAPHGKPGSPVWPSALPGCLLAVGLS